MGRPLGSKNKKLTNPFGVPSKIDGKMNPAYRTALARSKGVKPRSQKYGVPYYLASGQINPVWKERQRRAKGIRPRLEPRGKYGVKSVLPDGRTNPEWTRRWRADGHPIDKVVKALRDANYAKIHSKQIVQKAREWRLAHPQRTKEIRRIGSARRRGLSTRVILGNPFPNSHLHHLTEDAAVFIPISLHKSVWHNIRIGRNMDAINAKAMEFYERGGPR